MRTIGQMMRGTGLRWPIWLSTGSLVGKLAIAVSGGHAIGVVERFDALLTVGIAVSLGYILVQLLVRIQRHMLWRVRRKLILSYVFIGFVPVCLVVLFFAVAGAISALSAQSEFVRGEFDRVVADARTAAVAVGGHLRGGGGTAAALEERRQQLSARYTGVSAVVVAEGPGVTGQVGEWAHTDVPRSVPGWVGAEGFAGLAVVDRDRALVARAVEMVGRDGVRAVVVDIPINDGVRRRLEAATGVGFLAFGLDDDPGATGTSLASAEGFGWVAYLQPTVWERGTDASLRIAMQVPLGLLTERILGPDAPIGEASVQYAFLALLAGIGVLFLVIEGAALVMGWALARSITGSVHELFTGTEQVSRGDFRHRIRIESGDQLGDLADSFNTMTSSVEGLLRQAAEKERLEDELRIARQVQMSLLPRDTTSIPGLTITAICRPAREIGGDYYDFIRLGEQQLGLLVADVSGKGMSAALYMAELKGLMLSLGQIHESPRTLLIEANRIMAGALDSRSFITVLYAVFDLAAGTLTYARAGHTPLMYASGDGNGGVDVRSLSPDGLVLGLDGFETEFEALLEERRLSLHPGDLAVLFTDGVTEAMNEDDDLFGETRLQQAIETQGQMPADTLRAQILSDIEAFVGSANQHDDMTMVLVRVDEVGRGRPAADTLPATVD